MADGPPETAHSCEALIPKAKAIEGERIRTSRLQLGESQYGTDSRSYAWRRPGATDVATWYWPAPPNSIDESHIQDPDQTSTSVTWNGKDQDLVYRLRGYMTYLAWLMQPTGWSLPGMMDQYGFVHPAQG
jgi:hypothetical protein